MLVGCGFDVFFFFVCTIGLLSAGHGRTRVCGETKRTSVKLWRLFLFCFQSHLLKMGSVNVSARPVLSTY